MNNRESNCSVRGNYKCRQRERGREEERKAEMTRKGKRKKAEKLRDRGETVNELQQAKIETATARGREDRQWKEETD